MLQQLMYSWNLRFRCPKKGHTPRPNTEGRLFGPTRKSGEWNCMYCGTPVPVGEERPS
jgi:uncharacterized Zn-finger protein